MILRLSLTSLALMFGLASPVGLVSAVGVQPETRVVRAAESRTGVLLLAHGGSPLWNDRVADVAREVSSTYPIEVAFGMASRSAIESALIRLRDRGVSDVVAVPLFVSSHSSVVTSTEYLLGLRGDRPADLALFAKMNHGTHGAAAAMAHGPVPSEPHAGHAAADPTSPIVVDVPVRMTPAFNRHPIVGDILADRARAISQAPASEAVVLVAHGPVPDDDNRRWLADMAALAAVVRSRAPFAAVDVITVRDDAGPALRDAATAELRTLVTTHRAAGRAVLVVPHLMSFGGIEQGIRTRLEGLEYTMSPQALLPDPRVADWVRAVVASTGSR